VVADSSLSRRAVLGLTFLFLAVQAASAAVKSHGNKTSAPSSPALQPGSKPKLDISPAQDEKSRKSVDVIVSATRLWLQTMHATERYVPPYINVRLGAMYAILETTLTPGPTGLI
jgi:hypothetical protein